LKKKTFGARNKSGKIFRIKKVNKWKDFSKRVVENGMEFGQKVLDMFNKQKKPSIANGTIEKSIRSRE
jgi:hypothetical protein